jgi:hypothetical protein
MATEFRYVGDHADELDGGRPIGPGEYTGPIDADAPKNKQMIDDGLLIEANTPKEDTPNHTADPDSSSQSAPAARPKASDHRVEGDDAT